jgi:two-component system, cell cycle response regulator
MTDETRVTTLKGGPIANPTESCLVQMSGPSVGKRYPLGDGDISIGREAGNGIALDVDSVSRRHARICRRKQTYFLSDLGSTNGTHVNGKEVQEETALRSGDQLRVGRVIFKFLSGDDVESQYHEAIYTLAITDGLTQSHNKRYLLEFLEREMGRCHRYARPLSLLLFDIDHFKRINDTHGHLAGDFVLRELAGAIRSRVRNEQCFARYGGEEFAIVSPEAGPENARALAEKLRRMVQEYRFVFEGKRIPVTISLGVADMTHEITEPLQFIRAADEKLYAAKRGGRNRVVG